MDQLTKKTLKVSRGFTYTYYTKSAQAGKPTLLFFHGWPDNAAMWEDVTTNHLVPNGYGAVALDCLGYDGTSKPTDHHAYNFKLMAQDAIDILDAEGLDKVISVGHDWGSAIAARIYNHHPQRVVGLILLNVNYIPPSNEPFDLDAALAATEAAVGYGTLWYWKFFTAPDAAQLMNDHLESVWTVAHGGSDTWIDNWCKPDGMRKYVTEGRTQPTQPYATEKRKQEFMARFQRDGFDAPQCWYKCYTFGGQTETDASVPDEDRVVKVPYLFFGGSSDLVCMPGGRPTPVDEALLPDKTEVVVDAGHWSMHTKPKEFGETVLKWLEEKFPAGKAAL